MIFSSKGRHKLNVTPLIATFQKCIVLQHQKSLKKAQKSFTDYSMTMFQVFDETKTFKRLKKSGDWGDVKYAFIQDPIDYISITFTFTIYEYQFHWWRSFCERLRFPSLTSCFADYAIWYVVGYFILAPGQWYADINSLPMSSWEETSLAGGGFLYIIYNTTVRMFKQPSHDGS